MQTHPLPEVRFPAAKFATLPIMATPGKAARHPRPSDAPAVLTSRDNRSLKEFRLALRGGLPTQSGAVGVEGVRLVEEALRSGCRIEALLFSASGQSGTASPFSPKALRASAGAALHLPILPGMSLPILLTQLRIANIRTLATSVREIEPSSVGVRRAAPQLGNTVGKRNVGAR